MEYTNWRVHISFFGHGVYFYLLNISDLDISEEEECLGYVPAHSQFAVSVGSGPGKKQHQVCIGSGRTAPTRTKLKHCIFSPRQSTMSVKRGSRKYPELGTQFKFQHHVSQLATAQEAFAWHMLKACLKTSGNADTICFSPLAVHKSLSMVYNGARYESALQLKQLLRIFLLESDAALNLAYADISAIYSEQSLDHFGASLRRHYGTFATDRQLAAKEIDQWLEEESGQTVRNLLRPKALGTRVSVVAASAMVLNAKLTKTFVRDTRQMVFAGGATVPVVHAMSTYNYAALEDLQCRVLELPLQSTRLEMFLFLADHPEKLEELSDRICLLDKPLETIRARMHKTRAKVVLPRIKVDTSMSLRGAVQALGIRHPLEPTTADLSGMTGNTTLHLSHVEHRVNVDVDVSSNTKTCGNPPAASGLPGVFPVAEILPSKRLSVVVNGPFVFVVSDKLTQMIVAIGVIRRAESANVENNQ